MRILIYIIMLLVFMVGCGSHKQEAFRVDPKRDTNEAGETDFTLILINAVNAGDLETVKDSVAKGGDVNTRDNESLTLLMLATRSQQFAVMDFLVSSGADADLSTESERIAPDKRAMDYVAGEEGTVNIMTTILEKKPIDEASLGLSQFDVIKELNPDNLSWLLEKGADPNYIRTSSSGRPKDAPLIYLFSLRGIEGEDFTQLSLMFDILVGQPDIDVNLEVKRKTALDRAKRRLDKNPDYQKLIDKLVAMGAE
ncbi:MAG: hypothetical protein HRT44_10525 [Bdellovibrionales bacterium]|nr:hypothetical protein [Bdellovibrionales bacterium]NQZ19675.1 hypothetical protein [Bdellovibrionales bacterium]